MAAYLVTGAGVGALCMAYALFLAGPREQRHVLRQVWWLFPLAAVVWPLFVATALAVAVIGRRA